MMPQPRLQQRPYMPGLGQMLSNIVAGQGSSGPVVPAQPIGAPQPASGPGGGALLEVLQAASMDRPGVPDSGPDVPPGVPPANPLGLAPAAALAEQQTPAEAMPSEWMPEDAPPRAAPGMSRGHLIAGIFADMLAGAQGRPGMFAQTVQREREQAAERTERQERAVMERDLALRRLNQPQFTNVPGVGYVAVDPTTLSARVVQTARTEAQNYAESLGYQPGTPEYTRAVSDYALRSNGPTAFGQRTQLQEDEQQAALDRLLRGHELQRDLGGMRNETARRGQDIGSRDRRRGQDIGSTDRRRGQDLTDSRGRRGQDMTDARGRRGQDMRGNGRGPGRAGQGPRAVLNGRAIVVRGNQWVYEDNGQPAR
jgi:hypothetical protein